MDRTKPTIRLALGALLLVQAPADRAATVYRCTGDGDVVRFSQFPCGASGERGNRGESGEGQTVVLEALRAIHIPPLSDAERRRLDDLEQQRRADEARRATARRRAAMEARARGEEQRKRCEAARAARAALDRQRRKGYSLDEARALDRRDAELQAEERRNC